LQLQDLEKPQIPYGSRNLAGEHVPGEGQNAELGQVPEGGRQLAAAETCDIEGSDSAREAPGASTHDEAPSAEIGGGAVTPTGKEVGRVGRDEAFEREKGQCVLRN